MSASELTKHWRTLPRESLLRLQGQRLHAYLRDSVLPFSRHYAREFARCRLTADDIRSVEDLAKIPFTSKEDLLATPENPKRSLEFALIPDAKVLSKRPRVICRALLKGRARVKDELDREWRPTFMTSTTGRSTEAVAFLYTQHDIENLQVGGGRVVDFAKITRDERMMNLLPFAPHLAFWYMHYAAIQNNVFCLSTGGGKVMGTEGNIRAIQKLKPAVVVGMPTFIYHVMQQAAEEGVRLEGIRVIALGGEKVADGTRRKLVELAEKVGSPGVSIIATYGFTECKLAFSECLVPAGAEPTGYHLYPDMGIVEVVDPETGIPVPDGVGGEIVWTPLNARGTVVLRYRTGDFIENGLTYERCPHCGGTMPRLMGRISRVSDMRSMRFQKVKGTIVDFNELEHALDDAHGIGSWQIELRKAHDDPLDLDELVLHIAADGDVPEPTLRTQLNELMQSRFELRPNRIAFHAMEEMRVLQQVGVALKEKKIADNRSASARPTADESARADSGVAEAGARKSAAYGIGKSGPAKVEALR